jgi:uncharacterized protein (TIGR03083 family)
VSAPDLGELYGAVRVRIVALVEDLPEERLDDPVPACPGWTVRNLLGHVVGITDDALHGRMEGAPGEAWTARQVEARASATLAELLDEWERNAVPFQQALSAAGIAPAVFDVASHEQDLRAALGADPSVAEEVLAFAVPPLAAGFAGKATLAGLGPVRVVSEAGDEVAVEGDAAATLEATRFELFRVFFGRRSRTQARALVRADDPEPYLEHLFIFGPAPADLEE